MLVYLLSDGPKLRVLTEADQSSITLLLLDEDSQRKILTSVNYEFTLYK
jgi:hypothetical protein